MTRHYPLSIGFFTYLEGSKPQAQIYAEVIERFERAERVGLDSVWVAQHHFRHHGGLPSPLVFFASVAERIPRIRLGTAIVALSLEDPIRVAEDASVLDALHPGRLELGLGTGFANEAVLAAFGRAGRDRRELYNSALDRLSAAFAGEVISDQGDRLNPPAPALSRRIWESPASLERTIEVGQRGNGLLLSRIAIGGGDRPTPEIQVPLVEGYLAALPPGVPPRIGFSRTVYPTWDESAARSTLATGLEHTAKLQAANGFPGTERTLDEQIRHNNIHYGHPDQVVESLLQEPLLDYVTDLICQVQPGLPSQEQTLGAIELLASHVGPAIGWKPAIVPEPVLV